ncbi:hypothetical protein H312_02601 [Anncaliia algerae PRA339]|uniref:Uncharacterized protein n=1 Tax=Anncaliia algerae PRA339 TaxID=1288291 RepID=A0A059EYM5_9MICR|nr:hypothetical protein H312_02601 [Anncaliia algerae PRA339]
MVKGVKNECRKDLLSEFLFFDKFKEHALEIILDLLKCNLDQSANIAKNDYLIKKSKNYP